MSSEKGGWSGQHDDPSQHDVPDHEKSGQERLRLAISDHFEAFAESGLSHMSDKEYKDVLDDAVEAVMADVALREAEAHGHGSEWSHLVAYGPCTKPSIFERKA